MARPRGRTLWWTGAYLALLLASHLVRRAAPDSIPAPDTRLVTVRAVRGDEIAEREVRLAYRQWEPPGAPDAETLLMLHGSPGSGRDFAALGPELGRRFRVVAPDLPGFGSSSSSVPDFSVRAHAVYARQLLDALGIDRVHLVGFSMGGGVAIEFADRHPERAASLVLLSAIGVQELELLGNYHLNHAVHGAQLAGLWLLHEAVPHFGLLDGSMLSVAYARNFYDTDQRPLRAALGRLEAPTLILHGRNDVLVPAAAALEHHRLLPQSELVLLDGNHFLVFAGGERLRSPISSFVQRVADGRATRRADADPERRLEAARPFDPTAAPPATAVALLVMMALLATATLVTEDLTCIAAGLLVAAGRISFLAATTACFTGILIGDLALFWLGRLAGRRYLHRAPLRWLLTPEKVARSARWFERRGPVVILLSRFLPGTRVGTYVTAGLLQTPLKRFLFYFVAAVALWTPALVLLATVLGARAIDWFRRFQLYALPTFLLATLAVWGALEVGQLLATARGRRLLVGWWRRKRSWEFWPAWLFYTPLVLWYLLLAVRYRSMSLFTAANPGIPHGGFLGESKTQILDRLPAEALARYQRLGAELEAAEKVSVVREFLERHQLELPVVLKPDVGQRGKGVRIVRTLAEAEAALAGAPGEWMVQEYVEGPEFGVFYVRRPDQETGSLFSITEKKLPEVVGDGRATVEQLILHDARAVALSAAYLEQLGERAERVPAAGERVRIADLGTHCRGAIFLDGQAHATPALIRRVDAIARSFPGFYFGRFDIRAPSESAFRAGRDLKVLELNGVSSEATHIYDPAYSLTDAYRVLFRQWRLAFEIARLNRDAGARPARTSRLLASLFGR